MANSKGGYGKYAAQRGPYPWEPIPLRVKFWSADVAYETKMLHEAKAAGDERRVRMARRNLKAAEAELAKIGAEKQAAA